MEDLELIIEIGPKRLAKVLGWGVREESRMALRFLS